MSEYAPFGYTEDEIRSYLPSGWTLADYDGGRWDARKKRWSTPVEDTADMEWRLAVTASAVDEHGRHEALKRAFDDLYRERLGRGTRGLGTGIKKG